MIAFAGKLGIGWGCQGCYSKLRAKCHGVCMTKVRLLLARNLGLVLHGDSF